MEVAAMVVAAPKGEVRCGDGEVAARVVVAPTGEVRYGCG